MYDVSEISLCQPAENLVGEKREKKGKKNDRALSARWKSGGGLEGEEKEKTRKKIAKKKEQLARRQPKKKLE